MNINDECFYGKKILIDADSLCFTSLNDDYETAKSKFEWKIERLKKWINWSGEEMIFFLTIGKSFRNTLQPDYKKNRVQLRSDNVKKLKNYIIEEYSKKEHVDVLFEEGYEADDLICDMYRSSPDDYVLCSIDKDVLYNLPGKHVNLFKLKSNDEPFVYVTEEEAYNNFYKQIILGDKVDNIPSLLKGIGPVKLEIMKKLTNLTFEDITKYICYKKNIEYKNRWRILYCGKSEDIELEDNNIENNDIINSYIEIGKYIIDKTMITKQKNRESLKKYSPDSLAPGKYKDKTWLEVKEIDISYIKWMISATNNKHLRNMLEELLKEKRD
jgi:hypothetical protein